jgi:hypothetical protein
MKLKDIPPEFIKIYDLKKIAAPDGTIYIKIQKSMYCLSQAGILTQNLLKEQLNKHCYHQSPTTPGLWQHNWHPISFTLCVNDFGIKCVGKEHAGHLAKVLNEHYVCSIDWTGTRYIGMNMDWDYAQRQVHVSMLDYVPKALTCFHVITNLSHRSINHTHMSNQTTAQKHSILQAATLHLLFPKKARKLSKKSLALSSTMHNALTALCLRRLDP